VGQGRLDDADEVVTGMEAAAAKHGPLREPATSVPVDSAVGQGTVPFRELFSSAVYVRRILLLVTMWFVGYVTVYAFAAGFTSLLTALGYAPPEAGVIVAVGAFGFLGCAVAAALWAERLSRKVWLPISAAITVLGGIVIAAGGDTRGIAFIGAAIVFFGFNLWVPMTYARSAESFPTRARTTGFARNMRFEEISPQRLRTPSRALRSPRAPRARPRSTRPWARGRGSCRSRPRRSRRAGRRT
jgi:hypothetical protein